MKFSLSWLKDFVDINISSEEIANILTNLGIEVVSLKKRRIPKGVKTAKIISVDKHPNADRLTICKVDCGEPSYLTIVCGASNVKPEMIVPLATIGTKFENGTLIEKTKLRGIESFGMLCSEKELDISEDHSGIMTLPEDIQIGIELSTIFLDDDIFEIDITPNRGDCLSVFGIARELAAKFKKPLKNNSLFLQEFKDLSINNFITVENYAPDGCIRYCGRLIKNVRISSSPLWLCQRLNDAGLRPINNVVDITNYIMLCYGQPMHAFDYAQISNKKIIIKFAKEKETFVTLDEKKHILNSKDLLICDGEKPVALAGIMGGINSGISQQTTDVFLECAYFDPATIRKTAKRLGFSTESSYRFERGVDPEDNLITALDFAAEMLRQYANGTVVSGKIDIYPSPLKKKKIVLYPSQVNKLLGVKIPQEEIISILTNLQITVKNINHDSLECDIPLFRHDIFLGADLIEEVGRFYGYDNIEPTKSTNIALTKSISSIVEKKLELIRDSLAFLGLNEIVTNSLTSEKKNALINSSYKPISLLNPISPEMAQLRISMLLSGMDTILFNINRKNFNNRFFEIGKIYFYSKENNEPTEKEILSIILSGSFFSSSWNNQQGIKNDFYVLKGILEKLANDIGISFDYTPVNNNSNQIFENECACISSSQEIYGKFGLVKKEICEFFDIKIPIYYAELDITNFLVKEFPLKKFKQLPKFPAIERDFCFVLKEEILCSQICERIKSVSEYIESVCPFDVYRGEKLDKNHKSIAFSVTLRSYEKTLTDNEADNISKKIISCIEKEFGAFLRK
jgi:phenylalanyl-tRNA synthetase beta chain